MRQLINKHKMLTVILLLFTPLFGHAMGRINDFYFSASIISFFNFVLLAMSVVCIWQYFFPGREVHATLHVVNLISVVVFYVVSTTFLMRNNAYYTSYNCTHFVECLKNIFFTLDRFAVKHWIILVGVVINILYLIRGDDVIPV